VDTSDKAHVDFLAVLTRQLEPKSLMSGNTLRANAGVAGYSFPQTLDKTMRDRKHLVAAEVEKLMEAAKGSRHAARDRYLLSLMFRHGLRVSEACGLRLSQVDVESRVLHVARLKHGFSTTHPLRGDELRAIKAWLVERARMKPETDAFFISERHSPLSRKTAWLAIRTYGERAGLPVDAHPHMLRHACGFALADQGADMRLIQDYLGHRNIQHTVMSTATNPARFERFWR